MNKDGFKCTFQDLTLNDFASLGIVGHICSFSDIITLCINAYMVQTLQTRQDNKHIFVRKSKLYQNCKKKHRTPNNSNLYRSFLTNLSTSISSTSATAGDGTGGVGSRALETAVPSPVGFGGGLVGVSEGDLGDLSFLEVTSRDTDGPLVVSSAVIVYPDISKCTKRSSSFSLHPNSRRNAARTLHIENAKRHNQRLRSARQRLDSCLFS